MEDKSDLKKIAEHCEREIDREARKSVEKLMEATGQDWWDEWARTSPPDPENKTREPITAMGGAVEFGGGGSKRRKQPAKKMPEYMKTWGV